VARAAAAYDWYCRDPPSAAVSRSRHCKSCSQYWDAGSRAVGHFREWVNLAVGTAASGAVAVVAPSGCENCYAAADFIGAKGTQLRARGGASVHTQPCNIPSL
jgi:hypothetical protein